jgi:hypothetical protein
MAWFRVASDRLRFRGRLTRDGYTAWTTTAEGQASVDAAVRQHRLRLFRRTRARRRIWQEIEAAARQQPLCSAIDTEADHFAATLAEASYAPGLPRQTVALHRLVIVPRAMIAARTRARLRKRLYDRSAILEIDSRVWDFFCEQILVELDAAIAEHRPSAVQPIMTGEAWGCIGRDTEYSWMDPIFAGSGWSGHFIMYEFPRQGLSRKARKDVDQAVRDLQKGLVNLSRIQRDHIIRTAVDGLPGVYA